MLIVYAAVAGQSIVKLYAAAMLPGFFLTFLYLVYILGLGDHQPEDRAQAAARPVPRRGAGVAAAARARAGPQRRARAPRRAVPAGLLRGRRRTRRDATA